MDRCYKHSETLILCMALPTDPLNHKSFCALFFDGFNTGGWLGIFESLVFQIKWYVSNLEHEPQAHGEEFLSQRSLFMCSKMNAQGSQCRDVSYTENTVRTQMPINKGLDISW